MSNFVKWWHKNMPHFECSDDEALDIWNAAAASEREACATVCDQGLHQVRENGWIDAANERARCAAAIRQRSNGELTGEGKQCLPESSEQSERG